MRGITIGFAIVQSIVAILLLILILLQRNSESDGLTGNSSTNSGMGMSKENMLSRLTGWVGAAFVILTIVVSTMMVIDLK